MWNWEKKIVFFWAYSKAQLNFSENCGGKLPSSWIQIHLLKQYEERSVRIFLTCLSEGKKSQHNKQGEVILVFTASEGYQNDSNWAAALKATLYSQPTWSKIKASQIGMFYTHRLNILYSCSDFFKKRILTWNNLWSYDYYYHWNSERYFWNVFVEQMLHTQRADYIKVIVLYLFNMVILFTIVILVLWDTILWMVSSVLHTLYDNDIKLSLIIV